MHLHIHKHLQNHMWRFPKMGYPQIIHFKGIFHYKPSILGILHLWTHPYHCLFDVGFFSYPLLHFVSSSKLARTAKRPWRLAVIWAPQPMPHQLRFQLERYPMHSHGNTFAIMVYLFFEQLVVIRWDTVGGIPFPVPLANTIQESIYVYIYIYIKSQ